MRQIVVSLENLEAGLREWDRFSTTGNWASDLHNSLYVDQARLRAHGLNDDWWLATVEVLSCWLANRPYSKLDILDNGRRHLDILNRDYESLRVRGLTFETAHWTELAPLFETARSIKPTKGGSPVFASKLCHFMFPDLYVVTDGVAVGWTSSYERYWSACADAWSSASEKPALEAYLREWLEGRDGSALPVATKIVELCVMGARPHA